MSKNEFPQLASLLTVFLCDKNYRLFVTLVQSEGIFIRFPGPPSRFTSNNCYSGTAMQIRGTVAGIYGIRRLQVKRSGRLGLGPSSRLTVADHRRPDAVSP